ncbi:MAG: isochorismatase family protein [Gammaproteobacteria bacterium]|jgi:nicotinamidase-related amidase
MTVSDLPEQDYRDAGFCKNLGFGSRPALIIVDFVQAYLEVDSPLYAGVEQTRDDCVALLETARAAQVPVFHTNVSFDPGSADGGIFIRKLPPLKVLVRGSPLGKFVAGLDPQAGETVITKQYVSAFFATPLATSLTALGIDTLIIGGVTTSGCVRATALDALQHGFIPIVVRDAVGDRDPGRHESNLFDLQAKYADVVSLSAVSEYLQTLPKLKT